MCHNFGDKNFDIARWPVFVAVNRQKKPSTKVKGISQLPNHKFQLLLIPSVKEENIKTQSLSLNLKW